jgi:hypothetical protein
LTEEHEARMEAIEEDAKSDIKLKKKNKKEEETKTKEKKDKRDDRAKKFNSSVMEGVYDANPLLKAGVDIFGGVKSGIGRAIDWHKERKIKKSTSLEKSKSEQPLPTASSFKRTKQIIDSLKLQRVNSTGSTVLSSANDTKKPKLSLVPKQSPSTSGDLIKNQTTKMSSKKPKQPMAAKSPMMSVPDVARGGIGSGIGSLAGVAAESGGAGVAAVAGGTAELAGGALAAGGTLVAGIAALSEVILAVVAGVAAIAGVVGLAKYFFGGDDSKKTSREVSGKIITNGSSGDWKDSIAESDKPSQYDKIAGKQSAIDEMSNNATDLNTKNAGNVSVTTDNSVRSNNTTVIQEKLTTRNDDAIYQRFGYGVVAA